MIKKIVLFFASSLILFASDYILDASKSEVYYDAKKEQFFSTHTIISINKGISGILEGSDEKFSGKLNIDALKFDSKSDLRDSNVQKYLNVQEHAFITYTFRISDNKASGTMVVNGVSKKISFPVQMHEQDGELYIEGKIKIKYTDFGIDTPNNLIVTAHDDLVIGARLYFVQ